MSARYELNVEYHHRTPYVAAQGCPYTAQQI